MCIKLRLSSLSGFSAGATCVTVVTGTMHGTSMNGEYGPLTAYPHVSISDLFIFVKYDEHYKMTAVTILDAQSSTTPSSPIDKYISSSSVISLDTTTVSAMWDNTLSGYTTRNGNGYDVKDVSVHCTGMHVCICL